MSPFHRRWLEMNIRSSKLAGPRLSSGIGLFNVLINITGGETAQRTEKDAGGREIEVIGSLKSKGASPWRNSG